MTTDATEIIINLRARADESGNYHESQACTTCANIIENYCFLTANPTREKLIRMLKTKGESIMGYAESRVYCEAAVLFENESR